jgi:hypothetical protein
MTCKCAKRIAKLERDVTRLRAQLPKEIHHAVRTEIRVAARGIDWQAINRDRDAIYAGKKLHALGIDSYSEREG